MTDQQVEKVRALIKEIEVILDTAEAPAVEPVSKTNAETTKQKRSIDDVRSVFVRIIQEKPADGKQYVKGLLERYGVEKVSAINPDDFDKVYEEAAAWANIPF